MTDPTIAAQPAGFRAGGPVYRTLDTIAGALERMLLFGCAAAIFLAMAITTVDVVMRYGFANPLGWSFDFVMLYLLPAAYYFAFAYAMSIGAHLSVDFFTMQLPASAIRIAYPLLLAVSALGVLSLGVLVGEEAYSSFVAGSSLFGSIAWRTWPNEAIVAVSFLALALRLALRAYRDAFLKG